MSVQTPPWPYSILPPAPFWGRQEDGIRWCQGQMRAGSRHHHTRECPHTTTSPASGACWTLPRQWKVYSHNKRSLQKCYHIKTKQQMNSFKSVLEAESLKGQFSPNSFLMLIFSAVCAKVLASDQGGKVPESPKDPECCNWLIPSFILTFPTRKPWRFEALGGKKIQGFV